MPNGFIRVIERFKWVKMCQLLLGLFSITDKILPVLMASSPTNHRQCMHVFRNIHSSFLHSTPRTQLQLSQGKLTLTFTPLCITD